MTGAPAASTLLDAATPPPAARAGAVTIRMPRSAPPAAPAAALAAAACLAACAPIDGAHELLVVHGPSAEVAAPQAPLVVTGEGFPAGRVGTLRFEGLRRLAGGPAEPHAFEVPLHADGEGEARAHPPRPAGAARAAFAGALEVRFEGEAGATLVGRRAGVAWVHEGVDAPARRLALDATAHALADRAGWRLEEDAGEVRVVAVSRGGAAARAGLRPGDRLARHGPFPVAAVDDLLVPEGLPTPLGVRSPDGGARAVTLDTRRPTADVPGASSAPAAAIALAAAGAFVLAGLGRRGGAPAARRPAGLATAVARGVGIAAVPAAASLLEGGLRLAALWALLLLARALATPGLRWSAARLLVAIALAFAATAPAGLALVVVAAFSGASRLEALATAGGAPLLLALPPVALVLPALALAVDRPGPAAWPSGLRAFGAATATALLAGGWGLADGLLGHVAFAALSLVALAALEAAVRRGVPAALAWLGALAAGPACHLWRDALPAAAGAAWLAPLALAAGGAVAGGWALRRLRGAGDADPEPLHPFA